jgi:hypothetical protein
LADSVNERYGDFSTTTLHPVRKTVGNNVLSLSKLAFRSQLLRLTLLTETTLLVTRPMEAFMRGHPSQEISRESYVKSKQARMFALCSQIAGEYDRDTFTRLIYELNDLLEGKAQRLDGTGRFT